MSAVRDRALVRTAVEAIWNRGDLDVADGLFSADYVNHGGLIPDLVRGPEAIKLSVALYRRAFPDLHLAIERLETEGETVVLEWIARGAPPWAPLAEQGETLSGVTRLRVATGQIAESWMSWDTAVLQRLGIDAPDGASGDPTTPPRGSGGRRGPAAGRGRDEETSCRPAHGRSY